MTAPYIPTELFSASGLSTARGCARLWAFRYIMGLKEPEVLWCDIASIGPKPEPKKKSKPTEEEKKARKAWNKKYRPSLGKEVHARIEQYYAHAEHPCVVLPVDWSDVPGRVALAGLCHLPAPDACLRVEVEAHISIDLSFARCGIYDDDPIVFRGMRDLLVETADGFLLIDHKSTYTFDYIDRDKTIKTVKTVEQLTNDEQANLYALDVMQKYDLQRLACRWVYYRTEDGPAACAVDFVITREGAEARVAELVEQAIVLRSYMRKRTPPSAVPGNIESCAKFGCIRHPEQGGECVPPELSIGERLVQLRRKQIAAENRPKKTLADIARERKQKQTRATAPRRKKVGEKEMGLSFRDKAAAKRAEVVKQPVTVAADVEEPVADVPGEVEVAGEDANEAGETSYGRTGVDETQEELEIDKAEQQAQQAAANAASNADKAAKTRKPRAMPATGTLASTIAELAQQLAANDIAREDILARMRAALGAS